MYSMLKGQVFRELKELDTKYTLIHDVWTTKGNRFAFIGAAVAYINSNWEYTMLAQTTNSGSNNNTMASHMYQLFARSQGDPMEYGTWDLASMHIKCFCYKIALIVNAGLASLSLKTLPPGKAKESVLGFFPILGKVVEEDEEEGPPVVLAKASADVKPILDPNAVVASDLDEDSASDYGNANDELSDTAAPAPADEDPDDATPVANLSSKHAKTSRLLDLTQKLDTVIKQITQPAAQRASFDRMAKSMKIKVAPLIAGYGSQ
ncbi:hypothetical protein PCANC_04393 [Puccinia coronata f. sp. avenae]|uniref:hAT-like transposase RNase-H fold domain-containing protein n=1 Tax=Puccinia coronata f. sp. avenae TaxID=200324 RepID=A0A2N5VFD5_9BASI|nr:hypothetical protein PCANC_04393 [Puccinia coronata f. sp. avenae]PLW48701.1 hypothetical protein PCASD_03181 [Puccinia coronata f. sp. avenae]